MNDIDEIQLSEWLRNAIAAAKIGQRQQARELLMRVIEANERSEQAWLWLSLVVDSDEERLICLENALTLNPDNVQARAGLKALQKRGVVAEKPIVEFPGENEEEYDAVVQVAEPSQATPIQRPALEERDSFMAPDGCPYCGLTVRDSDSQCPHCGGRLRIKRFKKEERSPLGYLLHAYWILLAGVNVADFFLIGFVSSHLDEIPDLIQKYLPYFVGPVVSGDSTIDTVIEPETLLQLVRFALLALAVLGVLDAVGLFLRRPMGHTLGLVLIALHLVIGLSLFALGYLGYLMAAVRGLFTLMLTVFLFNTTEDFSQEERRERLEADRHLVNDADYFSRGRMYEKRGMWAKALLHWRRAVAMNPDRDTYLAATARAYAYLRRYDTALAQIDEAIRVSRTPQDWDSLRRIILQAQHGSDTASEALNRQL